MHKRTYEATAWVRPPPGAGGRAALHRIATHPRSDASGCDAPARERSGPGANGRPAWTVRTSRLPRSTGEGQGLWSGLEFSDARKISVAYLRAIRGIFVPMALKRGLCGWSRRSEASSGGRAFQRARRSVRGSRGGDRKIIRSPSGNRPLGWVTGRRYPSLITLGWAAGCTTTR